MSDDSSEQQPERIRKLLESLSSAQKTPSGTTQPTTPSSSQTTKSASRQKEHSLTPNKTPTSRRSQGSSVAARINQQQNVMPSETVTSESATRRTKQNSISRSVNKTNSPRSSVRPPNMGPKIPSEVLDDICFRFISNLPKNEKETTVRVMFQIELAHWFYVDFYCDSAEEGGRKDCPNLGIREFTTQMFWHCRELSRYKSRVEEVIDEWRKYKSNVPTYGAILLDNSLNHVLLVQGYFASKNSWGFPKGKVNENEAPRDCAVREVREETGFDFDDVSRNRKKEFKIQKFINDTMVRLYVIPDVSMDYKFAPQTRKEIRQIQWFNVWDLPEDKNESTGKFTKNKFYTILPFVQDLHTYIRREQTKRKLRPQYSTNQQNLPSYSFSSSQQQSQNVPLANLLGSNQAGSSANPNLPSFAAPANAMADDLLHSLFGISSSSLAAAITQASESAARQQPPSSSGTSSLYSSATMPQQKQQQKLFTNQQQMGQQPISSGFSGSASTASPSTTHFRPLNAQIPPPGSSNVQQQQQSPQAALSMLWNSLSTTANVTQPTAPQAVQPRYVAAQKPQVATHVTPPIVHPIPVHSHHLPPAALTSPRSSQQPRRSARLNPSHTSAFEVIPKQSYHGSAQQLHTAGHLTSPRRSDDNKFGSTSSTGGGAGHLKSPDEAEHDSHRTPISVRSNSTDITGELMALHTERLPQYTIQPCEAWKTFKGLVEKFKNVEIIPCLFVINTTYPDLKFFSNVHTFSCPNDIIHIGIAGYISDNQEMTKLGLDKLTKVTELLLC
ncbi:hypothetical protein WR25_13590 [Diploscapter pachys]|uniref:mRNA-decapping enzyme 2 n=1 Tax=Diploscapter pachys TaxID=2018661 RepID=A0A2A2LCR1_9BILA|nr:hypothetical protein WR25_13590 [Diploscapter pachys]